MDTPNRQDLAATQAQISDYFVTKTRLDQSKRLRCIHCGQEICRIRALMSLHDQRFGDLCLGPGRAWRIEIPYCPACENTPGHYGCIHMNKEELDLPVVLEASVPFGRRHPE